MIGNFALFFAIATAAPLVVLPAKDTVEEIVSKGNSKTVMVACVSVTRRGVAREDKSSRCILMAPPPIRQLPQNLQF